MTLCSDRTYDVAPGPEQVLHEWVLEYDALPATLAVRLAGILRTTSGSMRVRARLGGTSGVADGAVGVQVDDASTPFRATAGANTATNPTGRALVKLTAELLSGATAGRFYGAVVTVK